MHPLCHIGPASRSPDELRSPAVYTCRVSEVLSIQSAVSYGFAGNSVAVFALRRAGIDVWPVFTVNFSNHTGYGSWRGKAIPAEGDRRSSAHASLRR